MQAETILILLFSIAVVVAIAVRQLHVPYTPSPQSLKSKRRLGLLDEILSFARIPMRPNMPDPFACYKCLDDFDLHARDGHVIAAASHDKAIPRANPNGPSGKTNPALSDTQPGRKSVRAG